MPFVRIPPERLEHLRLFGYDLVFVDGHQLWYHGPHGRTVVDKTDPWIWVDDIGEAIQLGATAIVKVDCGPKKLDGAQE